MEHRKPDKLSELKRLPRKARLNFASKFPLSPLSGWNGYLSELDETPRCRGGGLRLRRWLRLPPDYFSVDLWLQLGWVLLPLCHIEVN
jgi:hypothetical protein